MPDILQAILPSAIAGVASALGAIGAIKAIVKGLIYRVSKLEECSLDVQRDLGRLEGRAQAEREIKGYAENK